MKRSTKFLITLLFLGLSYSFIKLVSGKGGGGLGDFLDGIVYTSLLLFLTSLAIIIFNVKHLKTQFDTLLFLILALPLTLMSTRQSITILFLNRSPNLTAKYPRPVSQKIFTEDSIRISIQIDSLIALQNKNEGGPHVSSALIDTIIYSQTGNQIFAVYAKQFEPNKLGNDLDPDYVSASTRDSIYWHLQEGPPNAEVMSGSYHDIRSLKKAIRQFYFNRYSFLDEDSLRSDFFWNRKK